MRKALSIAAVVLVLGLVVFGLPQKAEAVSMAHWDQWNTVIADGYCLFGLFDYTAFAWEGSSGGAGGPGVFDVYCYFNWWNHWYGFVINDLWYGGFTEVTYTLIDLL